MKDTNGERKLSDERLSNRSQSDSPHLNRYTIIHAIYISIVALLILYNTSSAFYGTGVMTGAMIEKRVAEESGCPNPGKFYKFEDTHDLESWIFIKLAEITDSNLYIDSGLYQVIGAYRLILTFILFALNMGLILVTFRDSEIKGGNMSKILRVFATHIGIILLINYIGLRLINMEW